MHHLTRRRNLLAYVGLGLTGMTIATALKGCTQPFANRSPNPSPTLITNRIPNGQPLPEFTGIQEWLNSSPLTIADRRGIIQYDHIGEGAYEITEQKIR